MDQHSKWEAYTHSRRDFLRTISVGTGAAAFASLPQIGRGAESGRKLGYALVGLGSLSTNQIAPALQKTTKLCRLAGIVTGTPAKAEKWAAQYNIPKSNIYNYQNFDSIRNNPEIDVVYVVLPNSMHAEYTIRAAKAGKHVLCEKPMANTAADCQAMIQACREAGRKLAIGYRCQFEPHHQECIRLAREKVFGETRMVEAGFGFRIGDPNQWRLKKEFAGGGAMMDVGIYALQATRYLTGQEPISVSAMETKTDPVKFKEVDESITWTMTFPSGAIAHCSTTYLFNGVNQFSLYADKGWFGLDPAYSYNGIKGRRSDQQNLEFPQIDHFAAEMDDFAECILSNRSSRVSGEEGLRDLKVIEAIYRSIATRQVVKVT